MENGKQAVPKPRVQGIDRRQMVLRPIAVEQLIRTIMRHEPSGSWWDSGI